jgi:hypothetical protein
MKCGARATRWEVGRVRCTTTLQFWKKNDETRHEVLVLERDPHVEQRRSIEASLSEVRDRLEQALPTKVAG